MATAFTSSRRAGTGPPLVCLHGFLDTWRTWELVLPALQRKHDVLAPTLPGHAGGPALPQRFDLETVLDLIEQTLDDAGFRTAHLVGNSLGGYLALRLAERGRARSVVACAPAGGWAAGDDAPSALLTRQRELQRQLVAAAPHVDALLSTSAGRRQATRLLTVRFEHIPIELLAHHLLAVARCDAAEAMIEHALREGWELDPERVECPVRIVWGTADELLPWPEAAAGYRQSLPHADWIVLDGVGHCPQLDIPLQTAQLILGVAGG